MMNFPSLMIDNALNLPQSLWLDQPKIASPISGNEFALGQKTFPTSRCIAPKAQGRGQQQDATYR